MNEISAQFPEKLQCLFQPKRYKILYGGRGSGRSWGVARWLLLEAVKRNIRVLCARELQNSIQDSVHKLLSDQIEALGLSQYYTIQKASIVCMVTGSEFSFEGIRNNVTKIKSYEGIDYCWVEEGQSVLNSSWDVLIPTIRKAGSEIIVTFNPDLEKDATYQRFVLVPPKEAFVIKMTYRDNPWFPDVLRQEMEELKVRKYDDYLWVWEGNCRQMLEGAVYADELRECEEQNRICDVPLDKSVSVDAFFDLGRSDHTSIWFVQKVGFQHRILDFYQNNMKHIDHYLGILQNRGYLYGTIWLPHDAQAQQLGSKLSIEEQVREKYPSIVRVVPKLSVLDGINAARTVFSNCWFDRTHCADGLHSLRHYAYAIDAKTGQYSDKPLHDEYSDAADAFRYFAVASKMPRKRKIITLPEPVAGFLGGPDSDMDLKPTQYDWMR